MRVALPRLVLAAGLIGALAGSAAGSGDDGFPTNLALLDRLSSEAVGAVLDSLAFQQGDTVTVMTEGGNEGDGFIAGAFARELARRGVAVHMTVEVMPPPVAPVPHPAPAETPQTPADGAPGSQGAPGDSTAALPDSLRTSAPSDTGGISIPVVPAPPTEVVSEPPSVPAQPVAKPGSNFVRKTYPDGLVLEFRLLEFGISYPNVRRRFRLFGAQSVNRLGGVYVQASRIEGPGGAVVSIGSGQSHAEDRLSPRARRLAEGANYPFTKPTIPPANFGRVVEPVAVVGIVASLVYLFYQNQN